MKNPKTKLIHKSVFHYMNLLDEIHFDCKAAKNCIFSIESYILNSPNLKYMNILF